MYETILNAPFWDLAMAGFLLSRSFMRVLGEIMGELLTARKHKLTGIESYVVHLAIRYSFAGIPPTAYVPWKFYSKFAFKFLVTLVAAALFGWLNMALSVAVQIFRMQVWGTRLICDSVIMPPINTVRYIRATDKRYNAYDDTAVFLMKLRDSDETTEEKSQ